MTEVARGLGISNQTIYLWRRQEAIDRGLMPGPTSAELAELVAARRRIKELETELAVAHRTMELLREGARPKALRGDPGDHRRADAGAARLRFARCVGVWLLRLARPAAI